MEKKDRLAFTPSLLGWSNEHYKSLSRNVKHLINYIGI